MAFRTPSPKTAALAALLLGALYLRFRGLCWGWPGVFDADAPHIVNLAVYFGSGDLNPHIFKYPTLWPYLLSAVYGAYFIGGLLLGAWNGVAAFGAHFVWHPADFHVAARIVTASLSTLAVWAVWRSARAAGSDGLWAAAIAAFLPVLVEVAHTPKADTILFLFSALAWGAALKLQRERTVRNAAFSGMWVGLAMSSQYTAAALALLPVCACLLVKPEEYNSAYLKQAAKLVLISAASALLMVFMTSPYIFLARHEFMASMADMSGELAAVRAAHPRLQVLGALSFNIFFYAGTASAAFLAALLGFAAEWRKAAPRALLFAVPCLVHFALLANHPYGGWMRFLIPALPGLIILSGLGAQELYEKKPSRALAIALAALLLAPGLWRSMAFARDFSLPDTRLEAAAWLEHNLPAGTAILLDQEHDSPQLPMSAEQAKSLLERTTAAGHPKKRYYELMANSHPGGGYKIYRIERSAADLESRPEHVRWSNSARDMVDIKPGLSALEAAGIEAVVLSSHGINPERRPEYAAFLEQLKSRWRLAAKFSPGEKSRGPELEIYVRNKGA